ncbi:TolB family protein [Candidatus Leptofilum sp.]|uniref:TolB family protein n=1 Tax=Candidatus Leptofilum sp. TaxID=3241576 RepID=UPI003B59D974
MDLKRLIPSIFILLTFGWLAACTADTFTDPTPIPPPPNADDSNAADDVADSTAQPSPLPLLEETAEQPTPTLIPTATPTAATLPTIDPSEAEPLPATNRDLLFLADGSFKQWNHTKGQIETIVAGTNSSNPTPENPDRPVNGSITAYAMNGDGKRAVVARVLSHATSPNVEYVQNEYTYELLFVDMISREVWTLVPQVDNLSRLDLSPDGRQLAFTASGLDGIPDATDSDPIPSNLYVIETGGGNPANLRQVHRCQRMCRGPKWHIESNLVAFGDDDALWLYNIATSEPEIILENSPFNSDVTDVNKVSVYWPDAWASNGRYLMLWHGRWEGGSRAVLDLPTGTLVEVPNTFIYADLFPSQVSWMPDDRVLVWHTEHTQDAIIPLVELWRFDLSNGQLILEESAQLSDEDMGVMGGIYLEDGRFAFALDAVLNPDDLGPLQEQIGTYQLTSLAEQPERSNGLPPSEGVYRQTTVLWAANGSGALLIQSDRPNQPRLFYAPADDDGLHEVTAVFGPNPHAFQWQPEIIVP